MDVIATTTVFTLTLWDNAAIYTTATEGDTVQLYDVKLAVRDGRYILTARFCDQIQVCILLKQTLEGRMIDYNNDDSMNYRMSDFINALVRLQNIIEISRM